MNYFGAWSELVRRAVKNVRKDKEAKEMTDKINRSLPPAYVCPSEPWTDKIYDRPLSVKEVLEMIEES